MNNNFNKQYLSLLNEILESELEYNTRTKTNIKAISNKTIKYDINKYIPVIGFRKIYPITAFAELCWTLSGEKKIDWLQKYTKMWDKFANNRNEIEAAYGYRWRYMFNRDQIKELILTLSNDPSNRQCFVSAWDNSKDGLGNIWTSNVPCPTSFCVNIINNKLNMSLFIRSSDVVVGLPYDCLMYSILLVVIYNSLKKSINNLLLGNFMVILSHAHIYEPHFNIVNKMVLETFNNSQYISLDNILWDNITIDSIRENPDYNLDIFKEIIRDNSNKTANIKNFKPEIIL